MWLHLICVEIKVVMCKTLDGALQRGNKIKIVPTLGMNAWYYITREWTCKLGHVTWSFAALVPALAFMLSPSSPAGPTGPVSPTSLSLQSSCSWTTTDNCTPHTLIFD